MTDKITVLESLVDGLKDTINTLSEVAPVYVELHDSSFTHSGKFLLGRVDTIYVSKATGEVFIQALAITEGE